MKMRMLIGYASRFGSTRDIAIRIAGIVQARGTDVDVRSVDEISDFDPYDHATAGFGASSVIHTTSLLELSSDLPVLIEVVDDDARIERLLPILDEMITGGTLVTMERVRVLKYAAGHNRQ